MKRVIGSIAGVDPYTEAPRGEVRLLLHAPSGVLPDIREDGVRLLGEAADALEGRRVMLLIEEVTGELDHLTFFGTTPLVDQHVVLRDAADEAPADDATVAPLSALECANIAVGSILEAVVTEGGPRAGDLVIGQGRGEIIFPDAENPVEYTDPRGDRRLGLGQITYLDSGERTADGRRIFRPAPLAGDEPPVERRVNFREFT